MVLTQNKIITYGGLAVAGIGILLGLVFSAVIPPFGILGALLCVIGGLFTILIKYYGYNLMPIITKMTKTSSPIEAAYEIPPSQDAILREANGVYYASAFLGIKIYESATEKSLEENIAYNENFERAVSNLKYVTKISYMLYVEDIADKRKIIETKRAESQLRLSREREKSDPDALRLDRYERDVQKWDMELGKLTKGVKPMGVIAYAMTTAIGVSKDGALANARSQANELRTVLANALNVEVELLTADQMLKCFEWERFFPANPSDLEDSLS